MIKVTVVVPVYNGEKTIKNCINSLLAQTLEELEIIVVDDGSQDLTGEILNSFEDRITVLRQNRMGQGMARNSGIKAAKGEYVGFVDADDTVCKDMYRAMYEAAKEKDFQVVQCGIRDIKEDGTECDRAAFEESVFIKNRADYIFDYFYHNKHTFEMCNKLVKKSFLAENGLFFSDTGKYFAEDLKLNCEMLFHLERIKFLDKSFYNYYIKSSGHCLSDLNGRIPKIINLFEDVLKDKTDDGAIKSLECVAAIILLLYCRAAEPEYAAEAICDERIKKYIKTSMTYKSNFKHFCLYLLIYCLPPKAALKIINIFLKY